MNTERPRAFRVTWRAGGWVLLLGFLLAAAVAWRIVAPAVGRGVRAGVDLTKASSYGIPLEPSSIPPAEIVGSGLPLKGLPALETPGCVSPAVVDSLQRRGRGKYLVSHDRVVGVTVNGVSRCYPLLALNWHEVINDTLGGVPIAVCYHPLSDAATVLDRRAPGGEIHLSASGLLWNSTHLLRDRAEPPNLVSPLLARVVVGPAAIGAPEIIRVPCAVAPWADWRESQPGTTVMRRDPAFAAKYAQQPYGSYFGDDRLRYPVALLPPPGSADLKSPVLVLLCGEERRVLPVRALLKSAGPRSERSVSFAGERILLHLRADPECAWAEAPARVTTLQAFWFAWHAAFPADTLAAL